MKKYLLFILPALLVLASCNEEATDVKESSPDKEIIFANDWYDAVEAVAFDVS